MLEEYLVDTCEKITTTRNEGSDFIYSSAGELYCRFRYINTIRRDVSGEVNDSDAMIWFAGTESIAKGDIIKYDGVYYEIERITKAKRLGSSEVQFIKCDLKIINVDLS